MCNVKYNVLHVPQNKYPLTISEIHKIESINISPTSKMKHNSIPCLYKQL